MAERARPTLLVMRDALAATLEADAKANPHLWAVLPVFYAECPASLRDTPLPAVGIDLDGEGSEQPALMENYGHTRHTFALVLASEAAEGQSPQEAIVDLWTDVRRAIMSNSRLVLPDTNLPGVFGGALFLGDYEIATATDGSGLGYAMQAVVFDFYWGPEAP